MRHHDVLLTIDKLTRQKQESPTRPEIAKQLGFKDPSSLVDHYKRLEHEGLIEYERNSVYVTTEGVRAVEILRKGE